MIKVKRTIIRKAEESVKTKFYCYRQNNAGGSFGSPAEIVIMEAFNHAEANFRLSQIDGITFDNCPCCGDRWSLKEEWDEKEAPDRPLIFDGWKTYSTPRDYLKAKDNKFFRGKIRVYYINGRIEEYSKI